MRYLYCEDQESCSNKCVKCVVCSRKKVRNQYIRKPNYDYYKRITFWNNLCEFITDIKNYMKRKKIL